MTKEDFVKVMSYAGVIYHKEFTPIEISAWYEFFKDIEFGVCKSAIKNYAMKNKYMPSIAELLEECKNADVQIRLKIVDDMYRDGYFKQGIVELTPEHELRNYNKAQMFVSMDTIPSWFLEDMIKYGYKQMIATKETKQIASPIGLPKG